MAEDRYPESRKHKRLFALFLPLAAGALLAGCALLRPAGPPASMPGAASPPPSATLRAVSGAIPTAPLSIEGRPLPTPAPRLASALVREGKWLELARTFDVEQAQAEIARLCEPEFGGRLAGSAAGRQAAEYLAGRFAALGLLPAGEDGTYWQEFTVPLVEMTDVPSLTITTAAGIQFAAESSRDFVPIAGDYVGSGTGEGPAVWVNRGAHDDYDGIDATGTIAVCGYPPADDAYRQAVEHGVAGLLIVRHDASDLEMGRVARDTSWISQTIPAAYITPETAKRLLSGTDLSLDDLSIQYTPLGLRSRVRLAVTMRQVEEATARNVLGMLPGRSPSRRNEIIVLGAHYDHVGQRPDGTIFPGANDDASGVAVLLEIARSWQEAGFVPERTVMFAAWDAEEEGLCGSSRYVAHPSFPLTHTIAMLQLDMVGAGQEPVLEIDGDGLIRDQALLSASELGVVARPATLGRSDHVPFIESGVPASLFIWGGLEAGGSTYHRPSDTPANIDPKCLGQAGELAELTALHLSVTQPALAELIERQEQALQGGDLDAYMASVDPPTRPGEQQRLQQWWDSSPRDVRLSLESLVVGSDVATATLELSYTQGAEASTRRAGYPARFVRAGPAWGYAGLATYELAGQNVRLLSPPSVTVPEAEELVEVADELYGGLSQALSLPVGRRPTLEVYGQRSLFETLTGAPADADATCQLLPGDVAIARRDTITEAVVSLSLAQVGLPAGRLSWLPAGVASILRERTPEQAALGDLPPQDSSYLATSAESFWSLDEMPDLADVPPDQIAVWRTQARSLAIHVLTEGGWPAVVALARASAAAPTDELACVRALGYPLSELEERWHAAAIQRWLDIDLAIRETLRRRTEAVASGDIDAFLTTVDGDDQILLAEQRHWFEDVQAHRLESYEQTGSLSEFTGNEATVVLTQELLPTQGAPARQVRQEVRFVARDGRWLYAGLPFETRSSDHFTVKYIPQGQPSEESLSQLLADAERAWAMLHADWPTTPEQVVVKYYPSQQSYQWSVSPWLPGWRDSWTQPGEAIKLDGRHAGDAGYVIVRELARQALFGLGARDAWLQEGVAAVAQEMYDRQAFGTGLLSRRRQLTDALRAHKELDLRAMTAWPDADEEQAALFRVQAWDTVSYLIREHGLVAVHQALEMRGRGRTLDDALLEATGQNWSGLVAAWQQSTLTDHFDAETTAFAGRFDGQRALDAARYLSGPDFAGRASGSPGGEAAARFIAGRFEDLGLIPAGDGGTYYQQFPITRPLLTSTPVLSFSQPDGRPIQSLGYRQDFRELIRGRAGGGTAEGEVVWVREDDLGDARLGGRIIIQRVRDDPMAIAERAWEAGAGGLILVLDRQTDLQLRSAYVPWLEAETMPVVEITNDAFVSLIKASGHQIVELNTRVPVLRLGFNAHLSVPLEVEWEQQAANVLGLLPGSDEQLKDELLIVGAHYDHVGSLPDGTIYPGANDNASGVGVLLELARLFQTSRWQPRRSILFAAWGAEEMGLIGSRYYVDHPWAPLDQTVAMVQLDMVGQGRGYYLDMHGGPEKAGELLATLSLAAEQTDVRASVMGPMGASDHAPFQERGVAAALLTWRDGQELHLPTDTPDLLDPRKLGVAGEVAAATLRQLADWAYVEERAPAMAMDGVLPWPALTPTVLPAPG